MPSTNITEKTPFSGSIQTGVKFYLIGISGGFNIIRGIFNKNGGMKVWRY